MADSPLFKRLKARAKQAGGKALDDLLAAEGRPDVLGAAVRTVQQGRRLFDEQGSRVVGALGLATQDDLDRVSKKLGRLRKRISELLDRLD